LLLDQRHCRECGLWENTCQIWILLKLWVL
jgi:hypothetical protein